MKRKLKARNLFFVAECGNFFFRKKRGTKKKKIFRNDREIFRIEYYVTAYLRKKNSHAD